MHGIRQRLSFTVAATVVAAALGTGAGYWLGRAMALHHAQTRLDQYGSRLEVELDSLRDEAQATLTTMNASKLPYCSDAELAWFRKLVFQSEYLKDAGHMRDGRIDCTATLGRLEQPSEQFTPNFTRSDGTRAYRNLAPVKIHNHSVISLQLSDSFIVYSPFEVKYLQVTSMHFTISDRDLISGETRRLFGELPKTQASILTTQGWARDGDSLYVTHCAKNYSPCITTYLSVPEALQASRSELASYMALCGLCGALCGFAGALYYCRSRSIDQQLIRAVRSGALRVVYQPIVELPTGRIVGAEALVRWTDEDDREIRPGVFVRIAEERGFVRDITRFVVNRALHELRSALEGRPGFRININIAPSDLGDPSLLPMLEQALKDAEVSAQSLAIEITEGCTARQDVAKEAILSLRQKGHTVCIDDFGTGYSSLAYLHDLAADLIKIDIAFTRSIGTESVTVSILPQILSMAETLNLQVIVEGIETREQADYFANSGRTLLAQGWLFGRAVPAAEFLRQLA
jgi:sensor c-di-GMP phosphodiesterase-like protein